MLTAAKKKIKKNGVAGLLSAARRRMSSEYAKRRYYNYQYELNLQGRVDMSSPNIIWVSPDEINWIGAKQLYDPGNGRHLELAERPPLTSRAQAGDVLAGDWDQHRLPISNYSEIEFVEKVVVDAKDFSELSFIQKIYDRFDNGQSVWGCSSLEQLNKRVQYLESVSNSMAWDGYKLGNRSDDGWGVKRRGEKKYDEFTVDISRDGELLHYTNGRHRFALARALDLDKIPVIIRVRHAASIERGHQEPIDLRD